MRLKYPPHYKSRPIKFPLEPLLVKLDEPFGLLPSGYIFELPRYEAMRLLRMRKAVAVGRLGTHADISLNEMECREALNNENKEIQ